MTDFGVTPAGFVLKTQKDIRETFEADAKSLIDPQIEYDSDDPLGQIFDIISSKQAELWELAEGVYKSNDPAAADEMALLDQGSLLGVLRGEAAPSTVLCTLDADVGTFLPANTTIAVVDHEDIRFELVSNFTSAAQVTTGVPFRCEVTGPVKAIAGTLTVIVDSVPGWNSVTNPADAIPGQDVQTIDDYRLAVRAASTVQGGSTVDAIRADLLALNSALLGTPIISVAVYENVDVFTSPDGIPPNCVEALVFDNAAVSNTLIAQTIWNSKPAGIRTYGNTSGNAVDDLGVTRQVFFSRPIAKDIHISYRVEVDSTYAGDAALKAAVVLAAQKLYPPGRDVVRSRIQALPFAVQGVISVTSCLINFTADTPAVANLRLDVRHVAAFATANITVVSVPFTDF